MTIETIKNGLFNIIVDGTVIGSGSMIEAENEDDFNYLERLDIDEPFRNQGHGTKAIYILSEKFDGFILAPDNADAKRLYERIATPISENDYSRFGFAVDQDFGVYEA